MRESERIAEQVQNDETNELISDIEDMLTAKGWRPNFFTTLSLAKYFLYKNNKCRSLDKAVIRFVKIKQGENKK